MVCVVREPGLHHSMKHCLTVCWAQWMALTTCHKVGLWQEGSSSLTTNQKEHEWPVRAMVTLDNQLRFIFFFPTLCGGDTSEMMVAEGVVQMVVSSLRRQPFMELLQSMGCMALYNIACSGGWTDEHTSCLKSKFFYHKLAQLFVCSSESLAYSLAMSLWNCQCHWWRMLWWALTVLVGLSRAYMPSHCHLLPPRFAVSQRIHVVTAGGAGVAVDAIRHMPTRMRVLQSALKLLAVLCHDSKWWCTVSLLQQVAPLVLTRTRSWSETMGNNKQSMLEPHLAVQVHLSLWISGQISHSCFSITVWRQSKLYGLSKCPFSPWMAILAFQKACTACRLLFLHVSICCCLFVCFLHSTYRRSNRTAETYSRGKQWVRIKH